jgi:magnesium chelatase family protein
MRTAVNQYHLSARSYFRILKVARTIADLSKSDNIKQEHLGEAIQYRVKEEN